MLKKIARSMAKVLALVAMTEVSTASYWIWYQPEAPKELQK